MDDTHMRGRRAFLRAAATTGTAAFVGLRAAEPVNKNETVGS